MSHFEIIKTAYNDCREEERKKIIDYLMMQKDMNGIKLFTHKDGREYEDNSNKYRGGMGSTKYKGQGLDKPYNLANWKYVETCYKNEFKFLISLQSFDLDPNPRSRNIHVLLDRIGIYKYNSKGNNDKILCDKITVADPFLKMETTEIELPMDNEKLKKLVEILVNIANR